MPPPSTCLVVATGLIGLIQPNFWHLRYLAALARSGYGEPNSAARGLDKSIRSSLHDAPSSDLVCDENGTDPVDTFASIVLMLGGRFLCQVLRSTFRCVCIASLGGALLRCSAVECSATS